MIFTKPTQPSPGGFFIAMSKPKKKRNKKYQPGRPKIPTWAYDAWGQLTEKDFKLFEDTVKIDLGLIRMGTQEQCRYGDLLYAMRQLFAFSERFSQDAEYQLLATMGTAAIHGLKNLADEIEAGKPRRPAVETAMLKPLEHAISTYFKMMRELYRSEHEAARREADNLSLTKALQDVAVGGIALVSPDETDNELSRCGIRGVAYVHDRCEPGYMVREDGQNFWVIPERETFVRMTEPTLMFFLDTEPSYANTVRIQNQDRAA